MKGFETKMEKEPPFPKNRNEKEIKMTS